MMKPRLMLIAGSLGMRGANRSLVEILRMRLLQEFDCIVALPYGDGPFSTAIAESGARTIQCNQPYWVTGNGVDHWLYCLRQLPAAVAKMRNILQQEKIDIVFTNSGQTPVGALAASLEKCPHVWYLQECFLQPATGLDFPAGQPVLAKTIAELSTALMVVSEAVKQEYIPYVNGVNLRVVPSGIDVSRFKRSHKIDTVERILSVGTTSPNKGLDDLVDAARILRDQGRNFTVDILGHFDSAEYESRIINRIKDYCLKDYLRFHGWREDSHDWYAKADIVCSPSHAESFGRSIVEGMAAGCPIVATCCGGPEEIVLHNETGLLVQPGSPVDLAESLACLLESPIMARSMGEKGQIRAAECYDLRKSADAWVEVIHNALSTTRKYPASGISEFMLAVMKETAPRMLLGKKYRVLSGLLGFLRRPILTN